MSNARRFAAFLGLALLMRWGTYFISVINHDESTYIVLADALLNGAVYHRDVIDTKPIGIFWIYALLIKLTGGLIPLLRLATTVVIALTAWLLDRSLRVAKMGSFAGAVAGAGYIFCCALFSKYGLSPNTEHYFNALTVAAVSVAVAPRIIGSGKAWQWPVAGLLLGCAVAIKPFAAAEALAVGLFVLWYYRRQPGKMVASGALLVAGFLLPLLGVYSYYVYHNITDQLWYYTLTVSGRYPVELAWYLRLKFLGDYLLRFSPFVILGGLAGYEIFQRRPRYRPWMGFLLVYFLLVALVTLASGKRFGHYQVQLHPVIALFAATFFAPGLDLAAGVRRFLKGKKFKYGFLVVCAAIGLIHFITYQKKQDEGRIITDYLSEVLEPGETFLTVSGGQIAYHLLDRPVPTPYVHYSILILDSHRDAFAIDVEAEAERLLGDASLRYLVLRRGDPGLTTPLPLRVAPYFKTVAELEDDWVIMKR